MDRIKGKLMQRGQCFAIYNGFCSGLQPSRGSQSNSRDNQFHIIETNLQSTTTTCTSDQLCFSILLNFGPSAVCSRPKSGSIDVHRRQEPWHLGVLATLLKHHVSTFPHTVGLSSRAILITPTDHRQDEGLFNSAAVGSAAGSRLVVVVRRWNPIPRNRSWIFAYALPQIMKYSGFETM